MDAHDFKKMNLKQIAGTILLLQPPYVLSNNSLTLSYSVDGKALCINLPDKQAAAQFLYDNGFIDHFEKQGDDALLFRKAHYYTSDHKGRPIMVEHYIPVPWTEIELSEADVKKMIAENIWGRVSKGESTYGNTVYNAPISNKRADA